MSDYSKPYSVGRRTFRYNYDTGTLEAIQRVIRATTVNRETVPVVREEVVYSHEIKRQVFERCPEYWVELVAQAIDEKE